MVFHWQWQLAILCVAFLFMTAGSPARAAGGPPALVGSPSASDVARFSQNAQQPGPGVVRHKPVSVNFQSLTTKAGPATQISVELFDGATIVLDLDRVETRSIGNYTWYGRIEGHPKGHAILTVVNGQMAGAIELGETGSQPGGSYQIQARADGLHVLRQIEQSAFPPDHPSGAGHPLSPTSAKKAAFGPSSDSADWSKALTITKALTVAATADSGSTIDVMIVYSNQTAVAAGSAIGAQIQQAVDTANTVYTNSGITTRLRLVDYEQVNYNESGNIDTDLMWLTSDATVASLRNTYGADLVGMFTELGGYCGSSWMGPSANYAFSVINRGCSSGNYSYPHEVGHLFGARHDTYVDSSTTPYAYGHGYVDCVEGWRDVMAYPSQCGGTRIPYLSNPNMTYGSPPDPLGTTATADNVRVHNQNAVTVANFRLTTTGGGCTYALSPTSVSFGASAGSASFSVTAGTGCAWNTAVSGSWLTIGAGSGTTDSGTLNYSVAANGGLARAGTIIVGGKVFTVNQVAGCSYSLSPTSASVAAAGGSGTTTLSAGASCAWNATSSASWLTVSSASSGSSSATITYAVGVNTGVARSANLTLGGVTFVVTQAATSTAVPAIATLSALQIQFANQQVGNPNKTKSVTLTNSGGGTLTISSLVSGGANPTDFIRSGTCAVSSALAGGQSCTLQYAFSPTAAGARSATLNVGTTASIVTLSLTGTG
ncbi:MAG TPA: choice-of-anchor D domain-containing protein, partial [Casimicrobiaceae bacterium]|nr:choice-of-anchor D domain-containing protein [Casimicrobiaceae bacterium]